MKLYELSSMYRNIIELDDDQLKGHLDNIEEAFEDKAENTAKVIKEFELTAKALREEEKRIAERRHRFENKAQYLKEYLEANMRLTNKTKFKTLLFSFNIQKNTPSVEILNEDKIPNGYFKVTRKVDKTALKEAIVDGVIDEDVAKLKQTESLRIR